MNLGTRLLVLAACLATLGGCADLMSSFTVGRELERAQVGTGQTPFQAELRREYAARAVTENAEAHYSAAVYFAKKAQSAAAGQNVQPTALNERTLPAGAVADLTAGRARLVAALDGNGRDRAAREAARAQRAFDCWMEEQEENFQPTDIAACRREFEEAIAQVEAAIRPVAAPRPPLAAEPGAFIVFFDWNKADLTPAARTIVQNAANAFRTGNRTRIVATGHADRSGSAAYNQGLSERRATVVRDELVRLGIPASAITTSGRGESQPLVPTADGAREPQNRRVEIGF